MHIVCRGGSCSSKDNLKRFSRGSIQIAINDEQHTTTKLSAQEVNCGARQILFQLQLIIVTHNQNMNDISPHWIGYKINKTLKSELHSTKTEYKMMKCYSCRSFSTHCPAYASSYCWRKFWAVKPRWHEQCWKLHRMGNQFDALDRLSKQKIESASSLGYSIQVRKQRVSLFEDRISKFTGFSFVLCHPDFSSTTRNQN